MPEEKNIPKSHRKIEPEDFGHDEPKKRKADPVDEPGNAIPSLGWKRDLKVRILVAVKNVTKKVKKKAAEFATERLSGVSIKEIREKGFWNWLKNAQSSTITGLIIAAAAVVGYDPDSQSIEPFSALIIAAAGVYDIIRNEKK